MASGVGNTGRRSRCYDLWMDFSRCIMNAEDKTECKLVRDDYFECLHHRKEFARMYRIAEEQKRATEERMSRFESLARAARDQYLATGDEVAWKHFWREGYKEGMESSGAAHGAHGH